MSIESLFDFTNDKSNHREIESLIDNLKTTDKEIICFPAGTVSKGIYAAMKDFGVKISFFGDNNQTKIGTFIDGIPILSFDEIKRNHSDAYIIVSSRIHKNDIISQFMMSGFDRQQLIYKNFSYYNQIKDTPLHSIMKTRANDFYDVYNLLSDDCSKKTFLAKLKYMQTLDTEALTKCFCENDMYFDNDIVHLSENEYVIDGGGFTGDTFENFLKKYKTWGHYYIFEPEESNFIKLQQTISGQKNVTAFQKGLWSKNEKLYFHSQDGGSSIVKDSSLASVSIDVISIDTTMNNVPVSFIKLDVEGSEYEALIGTKNTIEKYRPILAICIYHKIMDIVDLPLLMHSLCPDSKLYIRHYGLDSNDTVCYLIPSEHQREL